MAAEPFLDALPRARTVMARCDLLAGFSEEDGRLTRRYGTPTLRAAQDAVASWMIAAGMTVRRDAIGNLIGRYEGGGNDGGGEAARRQGGKDERGEEAEGTREQGTGNRCSSPSPPCRLAASPPPQPMR